ncbi:MAG: hypothetical protein ABIS84_07740 [Arachnia sp.]
MPKRTVWVAMIASGVGLCSAVVLTIISGVQYRLAEDRGLDPGIAPAWIVAGTNGGLLVFLLGALVTVVAGVATLRQRRRATRLAGF